MTDFEALLRALADGRVDFILVGGVAATIHGSSRLTADLDVVYDRSPENLERVAAALEPYRPYPRGAPPGLPFRWGAETLRGGLNFTLVTTLGDLDKLRASSRARSADPPGIRSLGDSREEYRGTRPSGQQPRREPENLVTATSSRLSTQFR